ncbi:MAG: thioredoxin-like domain-containing protein [Planctomycetota bacterium]
MTAKPPPGLVVRLAGWCVGAWLLTTPCPAAADSRFAPGDTVRLDAVTADNLALGRDTLDGRLSAVVFWASWSEPCLAALPTLRNLEEQHQGDGFALVMVALDRDPAGAKRAIHEQDAPGLHILNAEQPDTLHDRFFEGRYGIPHALLLAPDGTLLWQGHPGRLAPELAAAMESHPPTTTGPPELRGVTAADRAAMAGAEATAKAAAVAAAADPPDLRGLLQLAQRLPGESLDQPKVKAFGRSVRSSLDRLRPDYAAVFGQYRDLDPDGAAALDRWLDAAQRSVSGVGEDGGEAVDPDRLAARFAQAEQARAAGDDPAAYELYRWIVDRAPGTDEALLAEDAVVVYEADEAFMKQIASQGQEKEAYDLLMLGRNFQAAEMTVQARAAFRRVIDEFPGTRAAEEAAAALGE